MARGSPMAGDGMLAVEMAAHESRIIRRELKKHHGSVEKAASALGIGRRALERKMEVHDLRSEAATLRARAGIKGPRAGMGDA